VEDFLLGFKDLGLEVFHVGFQVADWCEIAGLLSILVEEGLLCVELKL
jgi:hypothetical protein